MEKAVYYHGDRNSNKVALTFDDGPLSPYTDQFLDTLAKEKVKATFFILGSNILKYPQVARRILKEGHVVGNHTQNHPYLTQLTPAQVDEEILKGKETIKKVLGVHSRLFRPPYYAMNDMVRLRVKKLGYDIIISSVTPQDWSRPGTKKIVQEVVSKIQGGDIVLLHDGSRYYQGDKIDRSQTVAALDLIIKGIKNKDLKAVTVADLLFDGDWKSSS